MTGTDKDGGRVERVRIPADVDRDDQLLAGLTARQLAILTAGALLLYAVWAATRTVVPLPVFAAAACPAAGAVVVLAVGRWHGLPADKLARAVLTFHRSPRHLISTPDNTVPDGTGAGQRPTVLRTPSLGGFDLPVRGIASDGVLDLGPAGLALLCTATAVSFSLRSPAERHALVAAFGRYLNSLQAPVQLLITAEPIDLQPTIRSLQQIAELLPHPGLQAACRDHAAWLTDFADHRPLLRRDVLLLLRTAANANPAPNRPGPADAGGSALRRAAGDAAAALSQAGVTLTVLDGPAAADRLARSLDPARPAIASRTLPDAPVTGP